MKFVPKRRRMLRSSNASIVEIRQATTTEDAAHGGNDVIYAAKSGEKDCCSRCPLNAGTVVIIDRFITDDVAETNERTD